MSRLLSCSRERGRCSPCCANGGLFRADADIDDALRAWTMLTAGVISQQLANAPHESFDEGSFTTQLPELVAMFLAHYGSPTTITKMRRTSHGNASRSDR